jgi:predicted RecB family nuclease
MAKFILATETGDEAERNTREGILKYNEEDLAATWAVFKWLREGRCAHTDTHFRN